MSVVYVLNKHGKALMPTKRCGHVRYLLNHGQAVVANQKPFTIKLKYDTTEITQPLVLGIDPGRTNIGVSVVTETGECVFSANAVTNNKDVPKRMAERKTHRMASRRGERLRRQRRARSNGTCFDEKERILPGCEEPITCKSIINSEARFNNRKRPEGWLTPTAKHLLESHINLISKIEKFLPVTSVVVELNKFTFMEMDNPNVKRWQYQRGPLYGKGSVEDAVFSLQNGHCLFCENGIDHYHHLVPRSKGGSNTLPNIGGLCEKHHDLVHKNEEWESKLADIKEGINKKYGALSVLNQIIPSLVSELANRFLGNCFVTDGGSTKEFRDNNGISKDHNLDAYCVACSVLGNVSAKAPGIHFFVRRFRRHDRAVVSRLEERKYYLDGKLVARNRHKRTEQKTDSLEEYLNANPNDVGRLMVIKGCAKFKDPKRILPGAVFMVSGKRMVLQGRHGKSKTGKPNYYEFVGQGNYTPTKCTFVHRGGGWQFV